MLRFLELRNSSRRKTGTYSPVAAHVSVEQLEDRALCTVSSQIVIANLSPVIFTGQSNVIALQWHMDTNASRGFVRCFQFTQADLVQNVALATLWKLDSHNVWRQIDSAVPQGGRILLDGFVGGARYENGATFQVRFTLNPQLTRAVIDIPITRILMTAGPGPLVFSGVSNVRLVDGGHPLSSTGRLYPAQAGINEKIADISVGIGPSGIRQIVFHAPSFGGGTNYRLYALDANGNTVGNPIGTLNQTNQSLQFFVWKGLNVSAKFRLIGDLQQPLQIGNFYATT